MKDLWAIGIVVVLATGIALGSPQPSLSPEPATDEEAAWIRSEIMKLEENPELQIAAYGIDRGIKRVTLWVYERTPENQRLHHEMIDGWEIIVAESPKPSVIETLTHPPCIWIIAASLFAIFAVILVKCRGRRKG